MMTFAVTENGKKVLTDMRMIDKSKKGNIKCEKCGITKKMAYSPGKVNKPKNAVEAALRLAGKEWNRRAGEEDKHETM